MRHLRLFPAVRERCGAGCRCGRSALRRKGRERTAPRRQARQGGRGRKQSPPSRIESSHYSSFPSPPPSRKQAAVRDGRPFAGFRCGQVSPCLARISGPPQHRSSVSSTATASGRLHLGFFTLSPAAGNKLGEQRGGGKRRLLRRREDTEPRTAAGCTVRKDRRGEKGKMSSSDIYLFRSRRKQVALAVRPSAVPNGIRSVPSGKSPCTGRIFACRRRERKPRIGAGGGTGPNLGRVHSAAVGRRRTADIGGGAISDFPGNGRTESSVSGETECDPHFARNAPRSEKHPKRAERFRRRRARLRTSHAMRRETETSETRRTLPEKAGASSDLARDVPGRKGYREAQNVSGDTECDPHFARNAPRSGNIRNATKASGEGGRVFGPRTRCAGTQRPPRNAERIRRYRTRSAFRTQIAEKRKHPKRAERLRRRRAPKRTQQGRRRDGKPDVFSPSEKSVPRRRHLFFSGKIPIFVRYLIRTNE